MKVLQLWRYPVKSMAGERLSVAHIGARGIPGDRGWAVFDETRQGVTNAKRLPALRALKPRYLAEPREGEASPQVEIASNGSVLSVEALGAYLGRPVSLRSLGPVGAATARRLKLSEEPEDVIRTLSGLEAGEPEPDYAAYPDERLTALRHDNFFDAMPIHLLTTRTLATLARIAPGTQWDPRRFRMNLLVETDSPDDYPELSWVGRRVRVGQAVIAIDAGCPRCSVPPQAFEDLPHDRQLMRTLVRETHHIAGVYAGVVEAGEVREGDTVEVL